MAPKPKAPLRNRDAAFEAFDAGALPKDLCKQGFTKTAAYKWFGQWKSERNVPIEPEDIEEPTAVGAPTDKILKPSKKTPKKTPITEETAGMILSTLFGIWASVSHEELRTLTPSQKQRLQGPFAATLQSVPNPIADLVNTYAPPISFVSQLVAVVQEQNDLINARNSRSYNELAQRQRAAEEEAQRIEDARMTASGNGQAPSAAVPIDKRQSTGIPEPEDSPTYFN